MRDLLVVIRGLALGGFVLSLIVIPIGALLLGASIPTDQGDNALGDVIMTTLGAVLVVVGVVVMIVGGVLAVITKRIQADIVELIGARRIALVIGLGLIAALVVVSSVAAGGAPPAPAAALSFLVGLVAVLAAPFMVVASVAGRRGDALIAANLAVALLALGAVILVAQVALSFQSE